MTTTVGAVPLSEPRPSFGRNAATVVVFLMAIAGSGALLARFFPFPPVPEIAARSRYFAERKHDFDTVFIGSSRMGYHIDPEQFDAETEALGEPTHSLNLGYPGMWPPESYYHLRELLALHPRHLRWVIIELMDYRFGKAEFQAVTMRMVAWHDWQHTRFAYRRVLESSQSLDLKRQQFFMHTGLFFQHMMNTGWAANHFRERYFPPKKKKEAISMKRRGFLPQGKGEWTETARADYAKEVQEFAEAPAPARVRPGLADALRELIQDVRRAGAEPVFVVPPSVRADEKLGDGLPKGMTTWVFNDPKEYPRLYLTELRCDPGHLNEDGAHEFTTLLAKRLAEQARKH